MRMLIAVALAAACVGPAVAQEAPAPSAAYSKHCETCHGKAAGGANAPGLVPYDAELSELVTVVRQGLGMMPAMSREQVSDEEIQEIYTYLKALTAARK